MGTESNMKTGFKSSSFGKMLPDKFLQEQWRRFIVSVISLYFKFLLYCDDLVMDWTYFRMECICETIIVCKGEKRVNF